MIIEEIRNIKSGKSQLRQFGVTVAVVLCLLGIWVLWKKKDGQLYFFIFSSAFLFLGLIAPFVLKPIHKVWMSLALLIGWVMTRVILTVLFYVVVTPIGLLARLSGKDFLGIRLDKDTNSYWIPRQTVKFDKRGYENQF